MNKYISILIALVFLYSCENANECNYDKIDCGNFVYVNDHENAVLGSNNSWTSINGFPTVVEYTAPNKAMRFLDGTGTSVSFISTLFPNNLVTSGCDIQYNVALTGATSSTNSLEIYNSTSYFTHTIKAIFVLNSSSAITGNGIYKTIKVPIKLGANGVLPSNEFGSWTITPSSTPDADVTNFNTLVQNISGISISTDVANGVNTTWYYDDFKIKTCCPDY